MAQSQQFRMGGRIMQLKHLINPLTDNFPVSDHNGTKRASAFFDIPAGQCYRLSQKFSICHQLFLIVNRLFRCLIIPPGM